MQQEKAALASGTPLSQKSAARKPKLQKKAQKRAAESEPSQASLIEVGTDNACDTASEQPAADLHSSHLAEKSKQAHAPRSKAAGKGRSGQKRRAAQQNDSESDDEQEREV